MIQVELYYDLNSRELVSQTGTAFTRKKMPYVIQNSMICFIINYIRVDGITVKKQPIFLEASLFVGHAVLMTERKGIVLAESVRENFLQPLFKEGMFSFTMDLQSEALAEVMMNVPQKELLLCIELQPSMGYIEIQIAVPILIVADMMPSRYPLEN